jgi:hypothetical protein
MLDSALWVVLTIAGPAIIASAIAYAIFAHKLSQQERRDYREAGGLDDYFDD